MLLRTALAVALCSIAALPASAETFFVGCNLSGLEHMSPENMNRVFWNRIANRGLGDGGESVDVILDLVTGDVTVECIQTPDENTPGVVYLLFPDGTLVPVGPSVPEVDPGANPIP
jgi:hypothetical protein